MRLACALAAVTSQPIRVINVRANRGQRGGLKAQHVSAIEWLAKATEAEVDGLAVGSQTLDFRPVAPATALKSRNIVIRAEGSAASTLLIFQAIFPYLLFSGNEKGDPVEIEIHGSTNPSFSPSYEYLDQVLLPTLQERFAVVVERRLKKRGFTIGPLAQGVIWLRFQPIPPGQTLRLVKPWNEKPEPGDIDKLRRIDVNILVPLAMLELMEDAMNQYLSAQFPEAEIDFVLKEDSGHDSRMYVLVVAHSESGLRWGQDFLYYHRGAKKRQITTIAKELAKSLTKRLWNQIVVHPAAVDEYLQDQLVVFQALAEGKTTYWSRATERLDTEAHSDLTEGLENLRLESWLRKDKTHVPFGFGSRHATTARWVVSELMPTVQWFNDGTICEGAGISLPLKNDTNHLP